MTVPSSDRAVATYSSLRTAVLNLTPGNLKCRLYCDGPACKFCKLYNGSSVIPGLYSSWITDDILAMARPQLFHFENDNIIQYFKKSNIVAVFNLQEPQEHAFCGAGNVISGFSYYPERFMENNIFHYNFPLPDFEACLVERMADIVTVMVHELKKGRIAVHCHAGHGRTGMVIAACLMRTRGLTPRKAVELVRSKRPSSVQSGDQVQALHALHIFFSNGAPILPAQPYRSTSLYVEYTSRILPKMDVRKYGNVPKPIYVTVVALLRIFFSSVVLRLQTTSNPFSCFRFECGEPTSFRITEEMLNLMSVGVTARGQSWYSQRVRQGMNILNLERFVETEHSVVELVSFMDYFIRSAFFQLTSPERLAAFLRNGNDSNVEDWSWSFYVLLSAISLLPQQAHERMSKLVAQWFARCDGDSWKAIYSWIEENNNNHEISS
ncbi:unnamed protein product [Cylicocyclus nassatus]|uniref:Uncharacterized protein n=1 Tax=Cylicocyclus nassatus TaxID=53992 RepID=A0AA36MCA3_CYLNA|nr:unnamed protein product [Cylicocyclus nassatus]